jgi:hypothetical protein
MNILKNNFKNNILYRFDLIVKYLYVKYINNNYNTDYFINLYKNHIFLFNNANEENKKSINDFIISFNMLIDSIKNNGFNNNYKIPINNNLITNGAHRLSVCYYFDIVPTYQITKPINQKYDYSFFKLRNNDKKLIEPIFMENCILEAIKINKDLKCLLFFPNFYKNEINFLKCLKIIKEKSIILFEKKINLTKKGLSNLIKEIYRGEEWIGGLFPDGINPGGKFNYVVDSTKEIQRLYLIVLFNNNIINLKKEIRNIYKNHHCVHTTDYFRDTFRTASALINENSIFFLDKCNLSYLSNNNKSLLKEYFNIINNKDNFDEYCLTSSIILELFGLRKANDIDYLSINNDTICNNNQISCHKDIWLKYYNYTKDEIIFNPKYHFYFNGVKLSSIEIIKKMKENRNEIKDINDIRLLLQI